MKTRFLSAIALSLALTVATDAALTTNRWTSSVSGKWETAGNWSAAAPTNSNAANIITNATTKAVTIDATTTNAANFATLTISNLVVSAPVDSTNTLQLTDAGTNTPLRILNGFTINNRGALLVTNSALRVEGVSGDDFLINGGVTLLAGASVVATNPLASTILTIISPAVSSGSLALNNGSLSLSGFIVRTGDVWMADGVLVVTNTFYIGDLGKGQITVSNGTVLTSSSVIVGRNSGSSRGTLTIAGGTMRAPSLYVGQIPASSQGTVWMTGGQLVATNSSSIILLGEQGTGEMTVSNGTVLGRNGLVGSIGGSRGTLTVAGGTNTFLGTLLVGSSANATGAVWVTGGQLAVSDTCTIADNGVAQMTVSNGTWLGKNVLVAAGAGSQGTLTIAGGTNTLSANRYFATLTVRGSANATGAVWVTGGQLTVTMFTNTLSSMSIGGGQMTVSNGTVLSAGVNVGSSGTLTIAGGTMTMATSTNVLSNVLDLGFSANETGTVWITGGRLTATNDFTRIGNLGNAQITQSNGTVQLRDVYVGNAAGSSGTLTLAGGTNQISLALYLGATGTVWVTGGLLTITNNSIYLGCAIPIAGVGRMTVSNGTWLARDVTVGYNVGSQGTLTIAGGTNSFYIGLWVGNITCASTGIVNIVGGELDITNAFANATLEVLSGTLTVNGGKLVANRIVITNSCAHFARTGGTLIYSTAILNAGADTDGDGISNGYEQSHGLDPLNAVDASLDNDGDGLTNLQEFQVGTDATNSASAFRITSIVRTNNDISVTWTTGIGKTNALERTAGDANGSYSNNFAAIFTVTNTVGTTTNYLDVGGATNAPSRYYRVRLVL